MRYLDPLQITQAPENNRVGLNAIPPLEQHGIQCFTCSRYGEIRAEYKAMPEGSSFFLKESWLLVMAFYFSVLASSP
jgi:hypothetical protein